MRSARSSPSASTALAWPRSNPGRQEEEKRQLRSELGELRRALGQAKLVYQSPQMEEVVQTARRVAATDATVLITGPSGTGKELLARTVHELSPRQDKPLITVDCGAISSSLIESELFGHERGAYTGAQSKRRGRLAEAAGGTVFLDEIGELPLEVQAKLLRFVQEKHFTPVGSSSTKQVDVRIIAATNRNLAEEVAGGRFREDLYYRLNVIQLEIPPLCERSDDILLLARHFASTLSIHYHKGVRSLSDEAEAAIVAYDWPGNVRELRNRILQAVILCAGEVLSAADLGFDTGVQPASGARPTAEIGLYDAPAGLPGISESTLADGDSLRVLESIDSLLSRLRGSLAGVLDSAGERTLPIGRWLASELLLSASEHAAGSARAAAEILGLPESTYRRRFKRAQTRTTHEGRSVRPESWEPVRSVIEELVQQPSSGSLLELAEQALLSEIVDRYPRRTSHGAALLGVSAPTYRRRVAELGSSPVA